MSYRPDHLQAVHIVELVVGINECGTVGLVLLWHPHWVPHGLQGALIPLLPVCHIPHLHHHHVLPISSRHMGAQSFLLSIYVRLWRWRPTSLCIPLIPTPLFCIVSLCHPLLQFSPHHIPIPLYSSIQTCTELKFTADDLFLVTFCTHH